MTNNRTFKNTDLETMRALTQCRKPDWTCLSSTNFHWISVYMAGLTCYGCSPCRWLAIVVNGWPWRKAMLHLLLLLLSLFLAVAEFWKNCVSNPFQRLSGLSPPPLTSLFSWVTTHSAGHSRQQSHPIQPFPKCTVISVLFGRFPYFPRTMLSLKPSQVKVIYLSSHASGISGSRGRVSSFPMTAPHHLQMITPYLIESVAVNLRPSCIPFFFKPLPTSS